MSRIKICRIAFACLLGIGLLLASQGAFAQAEAAGYLGGAGATPTQGGTAPPAQQGTVYNHPSGACVSADSIISQDTIKSFSGSVGGPIAELDKNIQQTALGLSANLTKYGLLLGGGFALLTALSDIMFAMMRKQSVWEPAIGTMIMALTAGFLVANYSMIIGFVTGEVASITNAIAGTTDPLAAITLVFGSIIVSIFDPMIAALNTACGFGAFFSHIGQVFLVSFILLITLFFVLLALVEILAISILAPLMVGIGTAVGPVFVGLIASRWTQKWFLKWIEFMLAAAILNLLIIVALTLLAQLFQTIKTQAAAGSGAVVASLGLMVLSMGLGKIFQAIPGMASAMVPGHHGVSGGGSAVGAGVGEAASQAKSAGGGGAGGAVAAAPSKIAAAAAPMRVAAAAIGGPAAVAAIGMMAATPSAVASTYQAVKGTMSGAGGGATASPPSGGGGGGEGGAASARAPSGDSAASAPTAGETTATPPATKP